MKENYLNVMYVISEWWRVIELANIWETSMKDKGMAFGAYGYGEIRHMSVWFIVRLEMVLEDHKENITKGLLYGREKGLVLL